MNQLPAQIWLAALAGLFSVGLLGYILVTPSSHVPVTRRRHGVTSGDTLLTRMTTRAVDRVGRFLGTGGRGRKLAHALDRAGVRRPPAEFVVIVLGVSAAALAAGFLIEGAILALCLAVVTPITISVVVIWRADRRKVAFADDLDDVLSLLATNLRAGHSVVQSLDTVAREMDDPTKTEIARAVNQVRIGKDLGAAISETADRMDSDEFRWVAQAVAIHRQVGGNLGEVLDTVGETIRERGRLHRQVRALSAEGRASGWVLMALPVAVASALAFINPEYLSVLTGSVVGVAMIVAAVLLMAAGGLWLRKVTRVEL